VLAHLVLPSFCQLAAVMLLAAKGTVGALVGAVAVIAVVVVGQPL
jgi:hypothetical protein